MITPSELLISPLFAAVSPALRSRIAARSADIRVNAGAFISYDGDPPYFWTMLEGEVEIVKIVAGKEVQVTTFDPGEAFGEVPLMLSTPSFSAMRALQPTRIMRTDGADFHALITESAEAARIIAQTLSRRVGVISTMYGEQNHTQATIVGERLDFACHDIRDFLSRNQIAYEWVDPTDPEEAAHVPEAAKHATEYPVVALDDGRVLATPTNRELACALGLAVDPAERSYDVVVVGGGPAGLAAAVYGGSEGLRTLTVESQAPGGQAGTSSRIENYLGFPAGVSGSDLAARALLQARRLEAEIVVTRRVEAIAPKNDGTFAVTLDGDDVVTTRAVVVATGVTWRALPADGAAELVGRGVYYGAARTEALGVRGKDIVLVGGGNSAGQAAVFFADYARSVTILIRGDDLTRTMSQYLIAQLKTKANIAVETRTRIVRCVGTAHLEAVVTRTNDGAEAERACEGLFVFIGADAETAWLPAALERDDRGYLRTGRDLTTWSQPRAPFPLETSIPGIFAAGDVRSTSVKRVAAGVGEGSMVIAYIHQYFDLATRAAHAAAP